MKRLLILIAICLPMMAVAQGSNFDSLMKKYQPKQGYTTIELSKAMLGTMGVSNDIEHMCAISAENNPSIQEFVQDVERIVADMNVALSVASDGCNVKIYSRSNTQDNIIELTIFTTDSNNVVAVNIRGNNLKLNEVKSLININI